MGMRRFVLVGILLFLPQAAWAKDAWVAYTAGGYNGKVMAFGAPSLQLLKEVPTGIDLHGPVLDGKLLYAVDKAANKVVVMDMATSKIAKTIPLPAKFGPNSVALSSDGKSLCVAGELSGSIAKVDTASGKVESAKVPMKPAAPVYAAITGDGKTCLVSDYVNSVVWVVTLNPFKVTKSVPSGGDNPHGIAITPDGKTALISNKFSANMAFMDIAKMAVVKTINTSAVPIDIVIDSKGQFAYQSAFLGNVVKKVDIAGQKVVGTFDINSRPGQLGISPDDATLFVLNKYSTGLFEAFKATVDGGGGVNPTSIQMIDLKSGKTVGQKPVPGEPFGIVIVPASSIKAGALEAGKDAVAKGRKLDLPAKQKVKLTYGPAKPHKPGVFDAADGPEVYLNAFSHQFAPNEIFVTEGDTVKLVIQNIDEKGNLIDNADVVHGFAINGYAEQTQVLLPRGVAATLEFELDKGGEFDFYCSNWCGSVHMEMRGKIIVE